MTFFALEGGFTG